MACCFLKRCFISSLTVSLSILFWPWCFHTHPCFTLSNLVSTGSITDVDRRALVCTTAPYYSQQLSMVRSTQKTLCIPIFLFFYFIRSHSQVPSFIYFLNNFFYLFKIFRVFLIAFIKRHTSSFEQTSVQHK